MPFGKIVPFFTRFNIGKITSPNNIRRLGVEILLLMALRETPYSLLKDVCDFPL